MDRSTYGRLPNLKTRPLPETVRKLADAVGLDRTEAFMLAGLLHAEGPTEPHPVTDIGYDEETEQLLASLPSDQRWMLQQVLEEERARLAKVRARAKERVDAEEKEASERFAKLVRLAKENRVTPDT